MLSMYRMLLGSTLFFLFPWLIQAANPYPQDYFRSPITENLRLSGTFGELRSGHFHSGIDIKGVIGQTLYAAADGYISRIRVSGGGYGKVIYLTHPNGYTTVYAHMNNFTDALEAYIKKVQYQRKSFEVDLYPKKGAWTFKKGEVIGAMGISGNSFGPHLHFEIRSSSNSKPINPLLFGLPFQDRDPPRMHQLRVYALNERLETIEATSYSLSGGNGKYTLANDQPLRIPAWRAGFAVEVFDHMNQGANRNGVHNLEMLVDGELIYAFDLESFSFGETRFLNAHIDYAKQVSDRDYLHRFYALPGNHLSIYREQHDDGAVKLYQDKPRRVVIRADDSYGNRAELSFSVLRQPVEDGPTPAPFEYFLRYDKANVIDNYSIYLNFPNGALYENLPMRYQAVEEASEGIYSAVHYVHNEKTPVHRNFDIGIRPTLLPDHLRDKAFIARCGSDNEVVNCGGTWRDGMLFTRVRDLGNYCIMADVTPPRIEPVIFGDNMQGHEKMVFRIDDNYSSSGQAPGLRYEAQVDGRWILMEYDIKNDLLIHRFDEHIPPGAHELEISLLDSQDNKTVFRQRFRR